MKYLKIKLERVSVMRFYEYGDKNLPNVMLIHGAGWSYWLYLRQAKLLQDRYHVIIPIIDGHGEERDVPYVSTEKTVDKLLEYIDKNCGGKLFAISGVSLGGQTAIELLSRRKDIAAKAIIESGVCINSSRLLIFSIFVNKLFGRLMFSERFNKWGLNHLPKDLSLPKEIKDLYLRDITAMRGETMNNIFRTYYKYKLKDSLSDSEAETIYWYGSKEMKCVKRSGELIKSYMKKCEVVELKGYTHGEISMYHPEEWVVKAEIFFSE